MAFAQPFNKSTMACLVGLPKNLWDSDVSRTLVGNNIFYHSDIVGASPVGAAPTTSSFWI